MFAHLRVNCVFLFIFAIDNETKITHNSMKTNRRDFLKAVGGIGLFSIVPSSVLGGRGRVAPSDQLTKGIIGVGGIGRSSYHFTSDK